MTDPARPRIPAGVWVLGFVSLLMDVSSEMIHALLPIYLVTGFGATVLTVGVIEGIAEATASVTKLLSGGLSDWLGRRKWIVAAGYALAALTKPVFPLAPSLSWLVAARMIDRVGKGIRGAPRDAMIADLSPPELRGASFGLRQSLDTVGAFTGPLVAIGLLWLFAGDVIPVFWIAVIPAFLALGLILFGVFEPERPAGTARVARPLGRAELARLGAGYWTVVAMAGLLTLARFSEAFLILRAQGSGMPITLIPLVLVLMNLSYALSSYPVGVVSDRVGRTGLMMIGIGLLIAADLLLELSGGIFGILGGVFLWGLHMGFTQGLLSALVADAAPPELRGTAFGMFNFVCGLLLIPASVIAGWLWDRFGPAATFEARAVLAAATLLVLIASRARTGPGAPR